MTAVAILTEETGKGKKPRFRAIAKSGLTQSTGKTAGEALDALTSQLIPDERGTIVIVQEMQGDKYFNEDQIDRMRLLLDRLNSRPESLSADELAELQSLVAAEFQGSARRTSDIADLLGR